MISTYFHYFHNFRLRTSMYWINSQSDCKVNFRDKWLELQRSSRAAAAYRSNVPEQLPNNKSLLTEENRFQRKPSDYQSLLKATVSLYDVFVGLRKCASVFRDVEDLCKLFASEIKRKIWAGNWANRRFAARRDWISVSRLNTCVNESNNGNIELGCLHHGRMLKLDILSWFRFSIKVWGWQLDSMCNTDTNKQYKLIKFNRISFEWWESMAWSFKNFDVGICLI